MINKLYEEIKIIIKENYKFLITMLLMFVVLTVEFPYYIEAPGGIINIQDRIEVENGYKSKGTLNLAYVSEYKATIPTILFSKINKDWKLIKRNTSDKNTTTEADYFRNHILLEEGNQNAIEVAYKKAGLDIVKNNTKLYITYVYEKANTDIQIEDEILMINNQSVSSKEDIRVIIQNIDIEDDIDILVKNNGEKFHRTAKLIKFDDTYILGISISEISDITVSPNIEFSFNKSESGPSGGLMMTLAIYDALVKEDITKGRKIVGTGTIDSEGNVGLIDGVEYKLKAAIKEKADIFLVPNGENYDAAVNLQKRENYDIKIIGVSTFEEALEQLKSN